MRPTSSFHLPLLSVLVCLVSLLSAKEVSVETSQNGPSLPAKDKVEIANSQQENNSPQVVATNQDSLVDQLHDLIWKFELKPQTTLASLIYDDRYITSLLDERYPYLKLSNGSYAGIRDYFNFDQVFRPDDDYLSRVNIEQALYNESRALETTASMASLDIWQYSDRDELERSGGPLKDPVKCQLAMDSLQAEVELARADPNRWFKPGHRNMELLRWIDSWARPVSETYLGDSFWVGSYRGCRAVELELNASVVPTSTSTRTETDDKESTNTPTVTLRTGFNYCWAKMAHRDWPEADEMRPKMSVRAGICLPDSCDTVQARQMSSQILSIMQYNFSPMHKQRFSRILDIFCLPNQRESGQQVPETGRKLSTGARWFLTLFGVWSLFIGLVSLWYCCHREEENARPKESWWRMLTLQENYRTFVDDDEPPPGSRLDLRALGLVKLVACLMVVLGHSFVQSYYSFHASQVMIRHTRHYGYYVFAFFWKSMEMFFVSSGILSAYSILTRYAPGNQLRSIIKPRDYLELNLSRYLRIAPMFMFIWAFVKTTYLELSEGPYWDYGTNKYTFWGQCKRVSWWRSLIWPIILDFKGYTGDPYQHECMAISWYIVTDLKMFLAVPLYVYLAYSRPRLRWPLLLVTLAISTGWKFAHLHLQQLIYMRQIYTYGEMNAIHIVISFLDSGYYSPIDRFQAVALGLTGGLYLYEFKTGRMRQWPWWMRSKLVTASLIGWWLYDLIEKPLAEYTYRTTGHMPSEQNIMTWMALRPRVDAVIITILVLRLCTDWAPGVMRHSTVLYKLSKLSYGVYVIHMLPILYGVMSHERARPDTIPLQLIMLAVFAVVASFMIAFPLYLLVESPLALLMDFLRSGQGKASKRSKSKRQSKANQTALLATSMRIESTLKKQQVERANELSVGDKLDARGGTTKGISQQSAEKSKKYKAN